MGSYKKSDFINHLKNRNGSFINHFSSNVHPFTPDIDLRKIDNMFKLFYQLILYSVIEVFSKIIIKVFKLYKI
jgi:hypothetical protein